MQRKESLENTMRVNAEIQGLDEDALLAKGSEFLTEAIEALLVGWDPDVAAEILQSRDAEDLVNAILDLRVEPDKPDCSECPWVKKCFQNLYECTMLPPMGDNEPVVDHHESAIDAVMNIAGVDRAEAEEMLSAWEDSALDGIEVEPDELSMSAQDTQISLSNKLLDAKNRVTDLEFEIIDLKNQIARRDMVIRAKDELINDLIRDLGAMRRARRR